MISKMLDILVVIFKATWKRELIFYNSESVRVELTLFTILKMRKQVK